MILKCKACERDVYIPYIRGQWASPRICSGKCFMKLLEIETMGEITPINGITIEKNKNPDLSMKSFYERRLSEWLDLNEIKWEYEPFIFRMPVSKRYYYYKPDFFLPEYNIFLEVKAGIWEDMSYKKVYTLAKNYQLFLITPDILNILNKENYD